MASLGFSGADFEVFRIDGFNERMVEILGRVRPRLVRLGEDLAPELARKLKLEFFPHVATHARRTVDPPPETWCAWGPSPRGYKRYSYLALCISGLGLHARVVAKSEAEHRPAIAEGIRRQRAELARVFKGTGLARYDRWDFGGLPFETPASENFWSGVAEVLDKKTGGLDVGVGWNVREALRLQRADLVDAFRELEPLYQIARAVV